MATIVVVIMGVAVAERSGFLAALMRVGVSRVPASVGRVRGRVRRARWRMSPRRPPTSSSCPSAVWPSAPSAARRSWASSSPIPPSPPGTTRARCPRPTTRSSPGITTAAAKIVGGEDAYVSPLSNWYFNIASSLVLAAVITLVTKLVLSKRPDLDADPDADLDDIGSLTLSARERSALRAAIALVRRDLVVLTALVVPVSSPLRGEGGSIVESPFLDGIAAVVALLFGLVGIVYGCAPGSITKPGDVPKLMGRASGRWRRCWCCSSRSPSSWPTSTGRTSATSLAVRAAEALKSSGMPIVVVFLLILFAAYAGEHHGDQRLGHVGARGAGPRTHADAGDVPAETTQALFRIADSGSTAITPMSPYFVMALGFLQRYRKNAGIGTLASYTLPLADRHDHRVDLLFLAWWAVGIPLGPGAPVR